MTNSQLLILALVLVAIYFYWKKHLQTKPQSTAEEPEIFWDASDSEAESEPLTTELPTERKDWFSEKHWLSDQEIDWALTQLEKEWTEANSFEPTPPSDPNTIWAQPASTVKIPFFKSLEATQFMFTKESLETKDADARFSFPVLLSELTGYDGDLVFIPVNNPDFHWSLLVYEIKTKKFTHFDTLKGANDAYVKPLVKELLTHLHQRHNLKLSRFYQTRYHLAQGNTWDCGIAVIEIAKAIIKDYPTYQRILLYTKLDFNFPPARQAWRQKLNTHA